MLLPDSILEILITVATSSAAGHILTAEHFKQVGIYNMSEWVLGIIGGSGLYQLDALQDAEWVSTATPWGAPSDDLLVGHIDGVECVFLPRHGRGHHLGPSQLNFRANIDAMKQMGVTDLISISAVGSLAEDLPPGHFLVVDQFIDRTFAREKSFSEMVWLPTCPSPILSVHAYLDLPLWLRARLAQMFARVGPISLWRDRNFHRVQRAISIASGARM